MAKPNQKHGIPRFTPLASRLMSRAPFLDGTQECYFGPGQTPDSMPNVAEDEIYVPPDDWPPSGALLRVPQVVWLTMANDGQTDTVAVNGTSYGGLLTCCFGFLIPPGGGGPEWDPVREYIHPITYPSRTFVQMTATMAVYTEVQATLATLRPGKTWATILQWYASGPIIGGYLSTVMAPRIEIDPEFFGTNFLHIHAGGDAWGTTAGVDSPGFPGTGENIAIPPGDEIFLDDLYIYSRAALVSSYDKFAGYAVRLFGWEGDYGPIFADHYTRADLAEGCSRVPGGGLNPDDISDATLAACDAGLGGGGLVTPVTEGTDDRTNLQLVADDLVDFGYTYEGDTSLLTADLLLARIADHFGFDPETGKDL